MSTTVIHGYSTSPIYITSTSASSVYVASDGTLNITAAGGTAIYAIPNIIATISNAGTIAAPAGTAISLSSGGSVANLSGGLITGGLYGIEFSNRAAGTVTNSGTIAAISNGGGVGVFLADGGVVSNGDATHTNALIEGYTAGIRSAGANSAVVNDGTVIGTGTSSLGVYLLDGGHITNGSSSDTNATIIGVYRGVEVTIGTATVTNYGRIIAASTGSTSHAVHIDASGTVINGTTADTSASIIGYGSSSLYIKGTGKSQVTNFGTIAARLAGGDAVYVRNGGNVVNGAANDTTALISSASVGVAILGITPSSVTNFGTILAGTSTGVSIYGGGEVINGSGSDTLALIGGSEGIYMRGRGASTVANYGTIQVPATAGNGVSLYSSALLLNGAGGDEAATIAGGYITNFGSIVVDNGGSWTLTGSSAVASGVTLSDYGTLTVGYSLRDAGNIAGAVNVAAGANLSVSGTIGNGVLAAQFVGAGGLSITSGAQINGSVIGNAAATLNLLAGYGYISGIGSKYAGFGTVWFRGGSWTMTGNNVITSAETLTISGQLTDAGTLTNYGTVNGPLTVGAGATFVNFGVLGGNGQSSGNSAVLSGHDLIELTPGAQIVGRMTDTSGNSTLLLAAGGSGTLYGLGTSVRNFGTVVVANGADWQLTGMNMIGSGNNRGDVRRRRNFDLGRRRQDRRQRSRQCLVQLEPWRRRVRIHLRAGHSIPGFRHHSGQPRYELDGDRRQYDHQRRGTLDLRPVRRRREPGRGQRRSQRNDHGRLGRHARE